MHLKCSGTIQCIPSTSEILNNSTKVFEICDKGLVIMATMADGGQHIRSLASAEQIRRQTNAINSFNNSSTFLAGIMILAALIQIVIAIFKT